MAKITHIVLHYSATYEDQHLTVKDIDRMHKARGWKMVGYHYVIRRDGKIERGRPETMVGAHVGGQNTGKIGICCIGGLNRATGPNVGVDNRTPAQIESQIRLIKELLTRYPGAQVVGHRDLAKTQCPGFDARTWWARVQHKKLPEPTPIPEDAPVRTPGVGDGAQQAPAAPDEPEKSETAPAGSGAARKGIIASVVVAILAGAGALVSKWCEVVGLFCGG